MIGPFRKLIAPFFLMGLAFTLTACGQTSSPKLTQVVVQLGWTHNAQFAGFYAADQKGYYAKEGLAVTFVEGGPNVDPITEVFSGKAQFGIAGADVFLVARSQGKTIKAVAVDYRRSPRVYIALANSGITRPQDFIGKTISVNSTGGPPLEIMMKRLGIQPDQYTEVLSTTDLASFYSGVVQVRSVFLTNEVITIRAAGYAINIIYPDDYGIHNFGDTLNASDELIATQPDLVLRFVRATLLGWTYAVEHSSEIGAMVVKYNPTADPILENEKMAASVPLVNTGEDYIGWMKPEIWKGMDQTLQDQGALAAPLDLTQVTNMEFLKEIYSR